MRRIGPVHNVLRATINLGSQIKATTNDVESTKRPSYWTEIWNEQDVRIMVLISLALQLFLLLACNVRRRRRLSGLLRFLVWLAYLTAYAVAASAIGLFSQYEDKYKIRNFESPEDLHRVTVPFLWAPFLLLHLGGPDTISAFSIEDNNLWTRQSINLVSQLSLAFYVFWKSFDLLDSKLLAVAVPLFVAGIIKYGERIWALKTGSRSSLDDGSRTRGGRSILSNDVPEGNREEDPVESRARNSVLSSRGLLAGRTLEQLGSRYASNAILKAFGNNDGTEVKLKFVLMELGMIYDMLYTKAMVLQGWTGVFRCVALLAMVVAFVLFWAYQHLYAQRTTNASITYTLFVSAIFVEIYSMFLAIASIWTRGRSRPGTVLWWLSHKLALCFPSGGLPSPSMGQFNPIDYCYSKRSKKLISKVSQALGLEKHWRNVRYVKHIEDKEIVDYIVGLLNLQIDPSGEGLFRDLQLGEELQFLLTMPFEHVLFRLHIFTEMHIIGLDGGEMAGVVAQCRKLSNYLMYLMAEYPSMLPVSGRSAQDLQAGFAEWVWEHNHRLSKKDMLDWYVRDEEQIFGEGKYRSPFKGTPSVATLMEMKEVWARLLIYAAGKCPMEQHARQLGDGLELLTVIGSLMLHQGVGNVGLRELNLLAPSGAPAPQTWATTRVDRYGITISARREPRYVFEFAQGSDNVTPMYVQAWTVPVDAHLELGEGNVIRIAHGDQHTVLVKAEAKRRSVVGRVTTVALAAVRWFFSERA